MQPVAQNFRDGQIGIAAARSFAKMRSALSHGALHLAHNYKQYFHKLCMPFLPDMAISFNDPHFILGCKVDARIKLAWFHTDASRIRFCEVIEKEMWGMVDDIVNVSEKCKEAFDKAHPYLDFRKSIVIENMLSKAVETKWCI